MNKELWRIAWRNSYLFKLWRAICSIVNQRKVELEYFDGI